jgi:uncharacterized protein involved in type VI secretion and phage assembly
MIDEIILKGDADKPIVTVQLTQSTSAEVRPKKTTPTMPTKKLTTQKTSEMVKEDKQETAGKNKSKTEEKAGQEELYQAIKILVASGKSIKAIE